VEWLAVEDYDSMSRQGAQLIYRALSAASAAGRPFNLGLATGNTMVGLYRRLAELLNEGSVDLSRVQTFNLDEYVGMNGRAIPESHPLSYRRYMEGHLFGRLDPELGFGVEQCHFPDPLCPDCFDRRLASSGGLDFQLLGIGFNGHIAFNEPMGACEISAAAFAALPSRVVALRDLTIATNSRLTAGNDRAMVPRQAVTMGMKQILGARQIVLLACFPEQVSPLQAMANGVPSPALPASYLCVHPDATVMYTADTILLTGIGG